MAVQLARLLAAEQTSELPLPPVAVGILAFGLLAGLLMLTLSFGKGRPHT